MFTQSLGPELATKNWFWARGSEPIDSQRFAHRDFVSGLKSNRGVHCNDYANVYAWYQYEYTYVHHIHKKEGNIYVYIYIHIYIHMYIHMCTCICYIYLYISRSLSLHMYVGVPRSSGSGAPFCQVRTILGWSKTVGSEGRSANRGGGGAVGATAPVRGPEIGARSGSVSGKANWDPEE